MHISIIGAGYVGFSTAIGFKYLGHDVSIIDIDEEKINKIKRGIPPIADVSFKNKKFTKLIKKINASTDYSLLKSSDFIFICVGTPSRKDGSVNLKYIKNAAKEIGRNLGVKKEYIIVVKSTVPPGTTEELVKKEVLKNIKYGAKVGFAHNPEFLREGNAINDFLNPDRIIIGTEEKWVKEKMLTLYKKISAPILIVDPKTSEMIKYVANAFLATKISFANEIGAICKKIGIDIYEVFKGVGLDYRISKYFFGAGLGFGGSCFPKDVKGLINFSKSLKQKTKILKAILSVNNIQPKIFAKLLEKYAKKEGEKKIGILGLSFKKGTDDIRESKAVEVIKILIKKGYAVIAYDPMAMENAKRLNLKIKFAKNAKELLKKVNIIGITTDWDEFKKIDYTNKIVVDGRNMRETKKTAKIYEGMYW